MKDYRVTVKVQNNRLLKAIEATGATLGGKWCAENGLAYGMVNKLVNMTRSPLMETGQMYPDAVRLCEVLNKLPEDLWSKEQLYPLEKNFSDLEMDHEQVVALLPQEERSYLPDFSALEREQTKALVSKVISTLNPQEQEVILMRFHEELTLYECGKRLGLTKERIRQIEKRAFRKMRKPEHVGILLGLLDDGAVERHAPL